MVDNQLAASVEEVSEPDLAVRTIEEVFLVHLHHRQSATPSIEPVSRTSGLLFLDEELRARSELRIS